MSEESPQPIEEIAQEVEKIAEGPAIESSTATDEVQAEAEPLPAPPCEPLAAAPEPPPAIPEELRAARWYTTGFLVVAGLLSIVALVSMILFVVRMYELAMD